MKRRSFISETFFSGAKLFEVFRSFRDIVIPTKLEKNEYLKNFSIIFLASSIQLDDDFTNKSSSDGHIEIAHCFLLV